MDKWYANEHAKDELFGRHRLLWLGRGSRLARGTRLTFSSGGGGAGRGEGGEAGGDIEIHCVVHGWLGRERAHAGGSVFRENGGKWWWLPPTGGPGERSRRARVRFVSVRTQIRLKNGSGMGRHADAKRTRVRLGRRVGPPFVSAPIQKDGGG